MASGKDRYMNVYEIITNRILEKIEIAKNSNKPFRWVKPWSGGAPFAVSYTTGLPYRGVNRMILEPGEYITFKALQDYRKTQPEDAQIFVKQGSHKNPVFYYGTYEKTDGDGVPVLNEYGEQEKGHYLRFYQSFNIEDIHGVHSHFPAVKSVKTSTKATKLLDKYIDAYVQAEGLTLDIVDDGANCFYDASRMLVRVPAKEGFKSIYEYYSSVLHELIHSTSKGLNRRVGKQFGSDMYSREELVAQIGSQMLLAHFQIADDNDDSVNDIAYIDGWASKLRESKQEIAKAAAQAEKAMEYFLNTGDKTSNSKEKMSA